MQWSVFFVLCASRQLYAKTFGPQLGSSMVARGGTMYIFGGLSVSNSSSSNDIVALNVHEGVYRLLPVLGERPIGRMFHSAFMQPDTDLMFVAGGVHCLAQFPNGGSSMLDADATGAFQVLPCAFSNLLGHHDLCVGCAGCLVIQLQNYEMA
jgi:hypothetical protein